MLRFPLGVLVLLVLAMSVLSGASPWRADAQVPKRFVSRTCAPLDDWGTGATYVAHHNDLATAVESNPEIYKSDGAAKNASATAVGSISTNPHCSLRSPALAA